MSKENDKFINFFIDYLKNERGYSKNTIISYLRDLNQVKTFLEKNGGFSGWQNVQGNDIEVYLQSLADKDLARTTQSRKMSSLRSFFSFLNKRELLDNDPIVNISIRLGQKKLPQFFYEKEMEKVFNSFTDNDALSVRNKAIFELFYATGMRVSEVVNLKIQQIDFDLKLILVHGKGNKDRYVAFSTHSSKALCNYLKSARVILLKSRIDDNFVFLNDQGKKLTNRGIEYIMQQVFIKAGVGGKVHPHMLRHSFATAMLNNGADLRSVQELLGHESLATTQIYTHVTTKHLQEDYDKFFPRNNKLE